MELYVTNIKKINGKKKSSYDFLRDSYLCYLMEVMKVTDVLLDEYIYWMNKRYGLYGNRITKENLEKDFDEYSVYHLNNFKYIINDIAWSQKYEILKNDVDNENFNKVQQFYETIISITDYAISGSYYYGRELTTENHEKIGDRICDLYPGGEITCHHEVIRIWLNGTVVNDLGEFVNNITNYFSDRIEIEYAYENSMVLNICNKEKVLCYGDLWEIIYFCNNKLIYFNVSYDFTDTKKLVLDPVIHHE